jgi:general secretion pathway protein E/type IV pilus assembly protein PilB
MTSNDDYVLTLLREHELVSEEQIAEARHANPRATASMVDQLLDRKVISEEQVQQVLAAQFGMEFMSLKGLELPADLRSALAPETARRYRVVPISKTDTALTVALSDPTNFDTLDTLRYMLKMDVEGVVTTRDELQVMLDRYYPVESSMETMLERIGDGTVDVELAAREDILRDATDATEADAPIIKLVSLLIMEAYRHRASDIHLEPLDKRFRVRYRIDGVLHEVSSPPKRLQSPILSRVKIMATMKISEKRLPQDGRIQVRVHGRELDLRVSTVPSNHGESIVMRILDKQNLALGLPKLGFFADDQQSFERIIASPDGIVLVTGPTGSGKTTTLYACLSHINRPDRKIITVENPVEYQMTGINQVQVNEDIGLTFGAALRSILRQAPNVVMIGEIRDKTTATIATEASLTGHLVFSTLHTNDAPSAVTRLLDIGVKPFLVASTLRAVMAQRLVRCICEDCREPYTATNAELKLLGPLAPQVAEAQLSRGRGCNRCNLTGYSGRKGIFEIFGVTEEIQRMIYEKATALEIRVRAREMGMRTLREDGLRKVVSGMTTVEEILRVTMGDED